MKESRLRYGLKLLSVNGAVFLVSLWLVNLLSLAALTTHDRFRRAYPQPTPGAKVFQYWRTLPNYPDSRRAEVIFSEFDSLRTRYEPFIGWSRLPFEGRTTTVGADGDRLHGARPRPGATRIARFFGGSTMWGTGVSDDGTIPAAFQRLEPDFVVRNHGEAAFTSRQGLDRLINLVARGERADLVVFYDGYNDVVQQCGRGIPVPGHGRVLQIREALGLARAGVVRTLARVGHRVLLAHSLTLCRGVLRRLVPRIETSLDGTVAPGSYDCDDDREKAEAVARALVANWQIARDIVTARGGEFHAVLQPHAHVGNPRVDHVAAYFTPEERASHRAVYPAIRRLLGSPPPRWVHDFTDAFDREETEGRYLLIDDAHVTAEGNEIIAKRLARLVRKARRSHGTDATLTHADE